MDVKPLKIALVAGEASGDRQGAALLTALREKVAPHEVVAWGIGGQLMQAAGVDLRHDCSPWSSIGIAATMASIPYLLSVRADMIRALAADPPDALVLIDSGGFNVKIGRWAKAHKICPVFYYFPPGSWRRVSQKPPGDVPTERKPKRGLADAADRIVTPFPWSEEFLRQSGADAHFVGHPLLDLAKPVMADAEFYKRFGLDPLRPLIALLPGSRKMEITHILPALIGAAGELTRRIPGIQFALALAPSVSRELVESIIRREQKADGPAARLQLLINQAGDKLAQIAQSTLTPPVPQMATNEGLSMPAPPDEEPVLIRDRSTPTHAPLVICEDLTYDVIARSDLVITKSGTSTLEAAILKKPMIIVYRGSRLMAAEWKLRKARYNAPLIGLPNILAERMLFPELLQDDATPEAIAELAVGILLQPERLLNLKSQLSDLVKTLLGEPGGVGRSADLLYDLIQNNPSPKNL